jgi:hypothetical protein
MPAVGCCYILLVTLSCIVVACLLLDPGFAGSNPAEDDGFLRAIKFCSTTSLKGEVKLSVPCCKISQHVKEPYEYETDT